MKATLVTLVLCWLLVFAGSAPVAAPEQGPRPGDMNPPNVWVQNRGPREAIPVSLYDVDPSSALRVQVVNTPAIRVVSVVATQSARQAWEYRQLTIALDQPLAMELNDAGADGWEATGVNVPSPTPGRMVVLLKRPR